MHAQRHQLWIVLLVGRLKQRSQARVSWRPAFSGRAATPAKSHQPSPLRWSRERLPNPLFPFTLSPTSSTGVWITGPRWVSASKMIQEGSKTVHGRAKTAFRTAARQAKMAHETALLCRRSLALKNTCAHACMHVIMCDIKDNDGGAPTRRSKLRSSAPPPVRVAPQPQLQTQRHHHRRRHHHP